MNPSFQSAWNSFVSWYSSTDFKRFFPLVGVILGWALARLTEIIRERCRRKRLKKVLYHELKDVSRRLSSTKKVCEQIIQFLTHGAIHYELPTQIPTHIFDGYYAEVSIDL